MERAVVGLSKKERVERVRPPSVWGGGVSSAEIRFFKASVGAQLVPRDGLRELLQ